MLTVEDNCNSSTSGSSNNSLLLRKIVFSRHMNRCHVYTKWLSCCLHCRMRTSRICFAFAHVIQCQDEIDLYLFVAWLVDFTPDHTHAVHIDCALAVHQVDYDRGMCFTTKISFRILTIRTWVTNDLTLCLPKTEISVFQHPTLACQRRRFPSLWRNVCFSHPHVTNYICSHCMMCYTVRKKKCSSLFWYKAIIVWFSQFIMTVVQN